MVVKAAKAIQGIHAVTNTIFYGKYLNIFKNCVENGRKKPDGAKRHVRENVSRTFSENIAEKRGQRFGLGCLIYFSIVENFDAIKGCSSR